MERKGEVCYYYYYYLVLKQLLILSLVCFFFFGLLPIHILLHGCITLFFYKACT